jgi:two-component system secretion response regulator SsrB
LTGVVIRHFWECQRMSGEGLKCVLLAERHQGLSEGIRGLLESEFEIVVMVADETSLIEGSRRLQPTLAVADLSMFRGESLNWIARLRETNAGLRLIVLSVHDEPAVCRAALEAGANGFVLKRDIATDLLPAVEAAMADRRYVSSGALDQMNERPGMMDFH